MNFTHGGPRRTIYFPSIGALLCAVSLGVTVLAQGPSSPVIDDPLDRVETISITSRPISEALASLSEKTKLKFEVDPASAELLPYGPKSVITIKVQNMPLRRGLTLVFEGLGMRMRPVAGTVQIVPSPFLERMNRRLSKNEQEVVYAMARATTFSVDSPPAALELHIDGESNAAEILRQKLASLRADNSIRHLEAATEALAWSWRLDDRRIVVERRRTYFLHRLNEPLNVNFTQKPVELVISEILQRSGVPAIVQNNAFQAVGAAQRKVDLITRRPAVKLLELVCQGAGLEFEVTDSGVEIRPAPQAAAGPAMAVAQAPPAEEIIDLLIEIREGVWASVRMPKSKIPPDLREALEKRMREVFGDNPPALGRGTP